MLVYDTEGNEHNKEPVDARECVRVMGWSLTKPEAAEEKAEPKKAAK